MGRISEIKHLLSPPLHHTGKKTEQKKKKKKEDPVVHYDPGWEFSDITNKCEKQRSILNVCGMDLARALGLDLFDYIS